MMRLVAVHLLNIGLIIATPASIYLYSLPVLFICTHIMAFFLESKIPAPKLTIGLSVFFFSAIVHTIKIAYLTLSTSEINPTFLIVLFIFTNCCISSYILLNTLVLFNIKKKYMNRDVVKQ